MIWEVADIKKALSTENTAMLCMSLAEMLHSGMTVSESFLILYEQENDGVVREAMHSVYADTIAGGSAADAADRSGIFPEYMIRIMRVAEKTGTMENVFRELSAYYDRQTALKRAIRSAVVYPVILLMIVLAVFFVFLTEVLPVFNNVFNQIGADMPPVASALLNIGIWLAGAKWWIVSAIILIVAAIVIIYFTPALKAWAARRANRAFSGGKTGQKISAARIASVLSLCFSGAKDIGEAMELADDFASGFDSGGKISMCRERVANGASFAQAISEADIFEPSYCRMIAIGEKTGSLDVMMKDIARRTQVDMETAVDRLVNRVEPASAIILTVCVGLLLLSVMLPLVGIMSVL